MKEQQAVEVVWWPKGWAPTTISIHGSIAAAEKKARRVAKSANMAGRVFIRIHYGPHAGERTLYTLEGS